MVRSGWSIGRLGFARHRAPPLGHAQITVRLDSEHKHSVGRMEGHGTMSRLGQRTARTSPKFNFGRLRAHVGPILGNMDRALPSLARHRPTSDCNRPNSASLGPKSAELGPSLGDVGPSMANCVRSPGTGQIWPMIDQRLPSSTDLGPDSTNFGPQWASDRLARCRPELARSR